MYTILSIAGTLYVQIGVFVAAQSSESHKDVRYFQILFDEGKFKELDPNLTSKDPLKFEDTKTYPARVKQGQKKTKLKDAIRTAVGKSMGKEVVIAAMDFSFIGGSMGSVVGEKLTRAIEKATEQKLPLVVVSGSGGGARMHEGIQDCQNDHPIHQSRSVA